MLSSFALFRRLLVAVTALLAVFFGPAAVAGDVPAEAASGVTFVYFGAEDCPYCKAFRDNGLADLKARAGTAGIRFVFQETPRLRDLRKPDPFGEWNTVWMKVTRRSGTGVPSFALIDNGAFVDSRAGDWVDLFVKAEARARKAAGG